jgi:aspartate ammonia-lyase
MTVGDEFLAWADGCASSLAALEHASQALLEVNLGGTAVGTGLAAPRDYAELAVAHLSKISNFALRLARRPISATTDASALLGYSAAIRAAAVSMAKVANDLRLLSSGPRTGFAELSLPPVQAGSSMMPGKVNPVIPEYANQAVFRIYGLDASVTLALEAAQLQLNAMLPVVAYSLMEAQDLLAAGAGALADRCVDQIEVNEERTRAYADKGLGGASMLATTHGYEASSALTARAELAGLLPDQLARQGRAEIDD